MNGLLQSFMNECFPVKERVIRDTYAPWFNKRLGRLVARKRRIYKNEGKTERYLEARKLCDREMKKAKKNFFQSWLRKMTLGHTIKG